MRRILRPKKNWTIVDEREVFCASPWIRVSRQTLELPDGQCIDDYYQVYSSSYVEVVPVDREGCVLMLWRYKHGVRGSSLGFPGGCIDYGETPEIAARRELHEECALKFSDSLHLGECVIDGNRGEAKVYFILSWDVTETSQIASDDYEDSDLVWADTNEIRRHLDAGRFRTLGAYAAALRAIPIIEARFGNKN